MRRSSPFIPRVEALEDRCVPATVPPRFDVSTFTSGLNQPTSMNFAPDGRLFVTEKGGNLRVVDANGNLLTTPFLSVNVNSDGERGMQCVEFDPNFATNRFLYVYYTSAGANPVNRVSRFEADPTNPNVVLAGSQRILLEIPTVNTNHNGGAMHFGKGGRLFVAVGESGVTAFSQNINELRGKILRLNASDPDNLIPDSNPYVGRPGRDEVWARGFRNPFTFAVHPETGVIYVNDVGGQKAEEINRLVRKGNYGWPIEEGPGPNPNLIDPVFSYRHRGASASIAGGTFYTANQFPPGFDNTYFFADFVRGWVHRLRSGTNQVLRFGTAFQGPVDIDQGPDGRLYVLELGSGRVLAIEAVTTLTTLTTSRTREALPDPTEEPSAAVGDDDRAVAGVLAGDHIARTAGRPGTTRGPGAARRAELSAELAGRLEAHQSQPERTALRWGLAPAARHVDAVFALPIDRNGLE